MKKSQLPHILTSVLIITLTLVSAGCGKKSKPVVPSVSSGVSQPAVAATPAPAVVEPPKLVVAKPSQPVPAKTDNLQLNVTAELDGRNVRGSFTLPGNRVNGSLTFNWNAVRNAVDYKVRVLAHRLSTRTDSVARITPLEAFTGNGTFFTIPETRPLKRYSFTVTAYDADNNIIREENVEFSTARVQRAISNEDIFFNGPDTTAREMRKLGKTVTIPVWKVDRSGKKYGSTLNVTVHRAIADVVLTIFTEIYTGTEQFPIYEVGGFRDGSGDHALGLAIDINANENMYISGGGRKVGKLWEPYKNQYSITPYGDVVTSFERHGFAWGGDSWSNVDYMHFFYLYETYPLAFERTPLVFQQYASIAPKAASPGAASIGAGNNAAKPPAIRLDATQPEASDNQNQGGNDISEYKFDDAFEAELRAKLASGGRPALLNFSNQLMSQGTRALDSDPDTAIDALRKAVRANPGNQRAHAWLTYILMAQNRTVEVNAALAQASAAGFSLNDLSGVNTRLSGLLRSGR